MKTGWREKGTSRLTK